VIGEEQTNQYESGQYYLYLHQADEPEASSPVFANWTWRSFVDTVVDDIINEHVPRYPQRTATQLHDLRDDLTTITNMSNEQTGAQEKIELYLEHVDAIEDVRSVFEDAWESYSERWDGRLATSIDEDESIDAYSTVGDEYPRVTIPRAAGGDEEWILRATGGDWQHLTRRGWYRHQETLEPLASRADDRNDLRIGFYFRMERHRGAAVRDHELQFNFRNMGSNPAAFKDIYDEQFNGRTNDIREHLGDTNGTLTGNKLTSITSTYPIPVAQYESFFDAYTAALHTAFVDFVVENPALIRILSETFEDAIEVYDS